MAKVIILCGRIASGKTYYAENYKAKTNTIILSVDDLLLQLSDTCLGDRHDDVAFRCENYLYGLAEQIIATGADVIIDYGYWLKKEREAARLYFKVRNIKAELHYIDAPEETRIRHLLCRNEKLSKEEAREKKKAYYIEEDLRKKLDRKFEEPDIEEIDRLIKIN